MASLPSDRTKLALAQSNQNPLNVLGSSQNKNALTEAYDTIDTLYNYTTGLISAGTLSKLGIVNVKDYNASGLATTAVGSITSGTKVLTLTSTPDFVQGQGINLQGAFEASSLQVTAPATVSSNVTVTLNGVAFLVAVASGDTAIQVATKIRAATYAGWTAGGTAGTDTVTFTSLTSGVKTDATYSAGTTGATGTMTTTTQGTADQISTVSSVSGLVVNIADNATRTITTGTIYHVDEANIVAAQNALSGNGVLLFPSGSTYNIFNLPLRSNTTYFGYGATLDIGLSNSTGSAGVVAIGLSNIKFIGFTLEGRRSQVSGVVGDGTAIGLFIQGCDNIEVIDCTFNNWYTDGINVTDNAGTLSTNINIIRPIVYNSRRNGIAVVHADGVLIEGGKITNTTGTSPQAAIDIEPQAYACKNVIVRGVRMSGNASLNGVSITGNGSYVSENVTVENCVSEGAERIATIGNAKGTIRILNNVGAQVQHYSFGTQYNNTLMDLFIEKNTIDGTSVAVGAFGSIMVGSGRYVLISRNVVKNSKQAAIHTDMTNVAVIEIEHNETDTSNITAGAHEPIRCINMVLGKSPRIRWNTSTNINGAPSYVGYSPTYNFEEFNNSWHPGMGYYFKSPIAGTWPIGFTMFNTFASSDKYCSGWKCVVAGTPGTWQAFGLITQSGTTAQRTTATASLSTVHKGLLWLDTTLAANGKPVIWTGTLWVDSAGTSL